MKEKIGEKKNGREKKFDEGYKKRALNYDES